MKTSLIVTTYNSPQYLALSIRSVFSQRLLPDEILVADDGSGEETRTLIEDLAAQSFVPLRHIWQPNEGFRAGGIRNKAIDAAEGEYIIQIDGDVILHPSFIRDHVKVAKKGTFVCGSRVIMSAGLTEKVIHDNRLNISNKEEGIESGINGLHLPCLTPFFLKYKSKDGSYVRSCNMAVWKEDLLKVNGYNEDISGWGREDSELSWRLMNAGVKKRFLKFGGIQYHMYHAERSRDRDSANLNLMYQTRDLKITRIPNGIVKEN